MTTIAVGTIPRDVAVDVVHNRVWIANYHSDNISVVNASNINNVLHHATVVSIVGQSYRIRVFLPKSPKWGDLLNLYTMSKSTNFMT